MNGTPSRVGFIGLGEQGRPIAERVAASFEQVRVFSRTPERLAALRAPEAVVHHSISSLAADVDVLQLCVRDDAQVQAVVSEALPCLAKGSVIVIHSTISPRTCREIAARGREGGIGVVDAPVSGGKTRALTGELTAFVGGSDGDVARLTPILSTFVSHVVRAGPVGSGASLKLLNNLLFAVQAAHVARLRGLLRRLGLDEKTAFRAIATSSGSSRMLEAFVASGADQLYYTHDKGYDYGVDLLAKDIHLAVDMLRTELPRDEFPHELADAADTALAAMRR